METQEQELQKIKKGLSKGERPNQDVLYFKKMYIRQDFIIDLLKKQSQQGCQYATHTINNVCMVEQQTEKVFCQKCCQLCKKGIKFDPKTRLVLSMQLAKNN